MAATTKAVAANAVFRLQELCDEIVCHFTLHTSFGLEPQADLRSTALVCHTLCTSAQSQIFRHLDIGPRKFPIDHGHESSAHEAGASAARRLSAIFTTSPHLLPSVRHLSVSACAEVLKLLSNIRFPLLQKFCIFFFAWEVESETLDLARYFIALPSMCAVELFDLHNVVLQLPDLAYLLDTCTPDLTALSFHGPVRDAFGLSTPRPLCLRGERSRIKKLRLRSTNQTLHDWLTSPSSPFDFTHLVDVEVYSKGCAALVQVATSAHSSIRRLYAVESNVAWTALAYLTMLTSPSDFLLLLDLSLFPALTRLELLCDPGSTTLRVALSQLQPHNCVQVLVLFVWPHSQPYIAGIEKLIVDSKMPALKRVEFQIRGSIESMSLDLVRKQCPLLEARGLLG
jgi:hypothetical protein